MTCSGWPVKRLRSTGSCVATPTGQVLRWHLRIMMQPAAIKGAVAKPNSSAPNSAPITTSRPVRKPPSTCTVMRRRRDQPDAGGRMPDTRDNGVDLVAGQLSAFAWLGALRHLDLRHVGVDEVFGRDAEAARGNLLDRRAHRIAVRHRLEAIAFLAAFAGVGLATDPVHRDRKRGVGLARDRAERHRAGGKTLDDFLGRLDLVERHRLALFVLVGLD